MKAWERYRRHLGTGDFHVHSDYTDGSSPVREMCEQAVLNGLSLICFAEHVRREILYDRDALAAEIEEARQRFPNLRILLGCEAKVVDTEGTLDATPEMLESSDIVVASFHDFHYARKQDFLSALHGMLRHPRVDIWGHPATFLRNADLTRAELEGVIRACRERKVLIEDSLQAKYLAPPGFLEAARRLGATLVTSSDAHHRSELKEL